MAYYIIGAVFVLYYLGIGLYARFGMSLSGIWPAFGAAFFLYGFLRKHLPMWVKIAFHAVVIFGALLAAFWFIQIFTCYNAKLNEPVDYLVVLGANVDPDGTPSKALRHRIEAAAEYLERFPEARAVASGGKGANEPISEAECIRQGLIARGIDESRILMEDRSRDTLENIENTVALVADDQATFALITNNYHVYRALRLAKKHGMPEAKGIAASYVGPTRLHFLLREAIGLTIWTLRGEI